MSIRPHGQVRGRDRTRVQALCFSSGLVGANFSCSFFHMLLFISWNSSKVSVDRISLYSSTDRPLKLVSLGRGYWHRGGEKGHVSFPHASLPLDGGSLPGAQARDPTMKGTAPPGGQAPKEPQLWRSQQAQASVL